ncbi:MAG TPA: UDP-N-acetylmuramoyl-tripeptide--D-alanyl-D-alanine ligase [Solirubrobacterales bacterium]|nr:UDP-N-acetylmuramoyl-tripeptide--D-alanyl-D-alanine ligase [Solirubrobacterales bacterium]
MKSLDGERLASAAGTEALASGAEGGPERVVIDSREVREGDLFVGLPGERFDGGEFGAGALRQGAWGILVSTQWGRELTMQRNVGATEEGGGWVLGAADPLASLQSLARAWREELACRVVGITGSTGKTSVKDICRALLPGEVHASPENYNTEIGMPLAMLGASEGTDVLVLEMGMRGPGQIAELCAIAEPDVGVITNVGPVHVELLGSVEAIAATKAEVIDGLRPGGTAVVPADAGPLEPHLERAPRLLRFGAGGDVEAVEVMAEAGQTKALVRIPAGARRFKFPFVEAHNLENALAAIAAGVALGFPLDEMADLAPRIVFSRLRGELVELPEDAILINDSYNANPISMRAALDHLASLEAGGRRVAVLGEMRELGPDAAAYHREIGEYARERGVEHLIGVGEQASSYEPDEQVADAEAAADALAAALRPGDAVLVKGSRAVGLERVAEKLAESDR